MAFPASGRGRPSAPERVVLIAPSDHPASTEQLVRALGAQLSDVDVALQMTRVASLPEELEAQLRLARANLREATVAVLWLEESTGRLRILLPGGLGGRLVTRAVGAAGEAGRYEATGVILRTTLLSRRAGKEVGVALLPPLPAPRRPGVAAPPARVGCPPMRLCPQAKPRPPARVSLDVAWAADIYAPEALFATGLRVGLDLRLHPQWRIFAGYRLEAPLKAEGDDAGLELRRHPVDLGARFLWPSGRFRLGGRVAIGLVVVSPRVLWYGPELRPLQKGHDVVFTVTPQLSAAFQPAPRLWLVLDLGFSVQLGNVRYAAEPSGEVLVSPLIVQPALLLGLQVELF